MWVFPSVSDRQLMPTYTYKCSRCERVYELVQGIREPAAVECDLPIDVAVSDGGGGAVGVVKCGGVVGRVIVASGGFILHGGGWAKDGY